MFVAYKYSPSDFFYNNNLNPYLTKGTELYNEHKKTVRNCLSKFISSDGIVNGSELRENWFSVETTDVFISHSHKDISKVKAFAGWLYDRFGLTSFIDSCVWGYCDDLLHEIDKKYCYQQESGTYNYSLRNYTTSHVHMMLSTALVETMNRSECILFFNTPNSIVMKKELSLISNKESKKTMSPWIFYELTMISKIKRMKPDRRKSILSHAEYEKRDLINIQYDVSKIIDDIPTIGDKQLIEWSKIHNQWHHSLDELYKIMGDI